ncbi:MAG: hypothetical protein U0U69_14780 [Acidimicrobiia bacterium]
MPEVAEVLVDVRPLDAPYDYAVPAGTDVEVGSLVRVDFAGRSVRGWVVGVGPGSGSPIASADLKPIRRVLSGMAVADAATITLAKWAAAEYAGSPTALLGWATPAPLPHRPRPVAVAPASATASAARARIPGVSEAIAGGERVEAAIRTWPGDDAAATVAALASAVPPGRTLLVVSPPSWQPRVPGAVDLTHGGTRAWEAAASGAARVVVGGRHATLVPIPALAAVCVTAEHSDVHKDRQTPCLDARVLARRRAEDAGVSFVAIGPTSPVGVEGLRAEAEASGRPLPLTLDVPGAAAHWPHVEVVDLRAEPPGTGALSSRFFRAVRDAHTSGAATLVYLNRKGTARSMVCRACGSAAECPECATLLRPEGDDLVCPRCDRRLEPRSCPQCASADLRRVGLGIDRLGSELRAALPGVTITESSGDSAVAPVPGGIVVGTRAAFRHRRCFDLVVLVDPDADLGRPGLRSDEMAFAALVDAIGTARSRADGGRVLVQTRRPRSAAIAALAAHDPHRFEAEVLERRRFEGLPPFRRILAVSSPSAEAVADAASALAALGTDVIGPRADPRPEMLALVPRDRWHAATRTAREVALAHRPTRVRVEADPLDPG